MIANQFIKIKLSVKNIEKSLLIFKKCKYFFYSAHTPNMDVLTKVIKEINVLFSKIVLALHKLVLKTF